MDRHAIYEVNDLSLDNSDLLLNETIFHNANGYIGVRSNFEEGYPMGYDSIRGSYINGIYDFCDMKQAESLCGLIEEKQTMLNIADPQGITLKAEDETFSMFEGTVKKSRRYLDMENGFTKRVVQWISPKGRELQVTSRRMASFTQLSLFLIEYTVESVNFEGVLTFTSSHSGDVTNYANPDDPRVASESMKYILPEKPKVQEGASYIRAVTSRSGLSVCTGVKNVLSAKPIEDEISIDKYSVSQSFQIHVRPGENVTLTKYVIFTDSIRSGDCLQAALSKMQDVLSLSVDDWHKRQKEYLNDFWKNSLLEIDGDDELAIAVRYNQYQLLQSAGKDRYSNIAAKGLSGEGYEGHYFWDTEMYMQPFFILANPEIARNLIEYRYEILDMARQNAYRLGHTSGALYPWRTIMGKECSGYFPSGAAQYHINGDIAYSVGNYYLATGDLEFLAEKGAEIVFETARLWLDVGNFHDGRFYIHAVTGPDEYTCLVNNNYYTNATAKHNLQLAVKFWSLLESEGKLDTVRDKIALKKEEIEQFAQAAEQMYLPYDEKLGINPQDDSFLTKKVWDLEHTPKEDFPLLLHYHPLCLYRYQVCKQADTVLAHFIFEEEQSQEVIQKSFEYYEAITTHDSSLSTCIFSIVASRLGLHEKAYEYFGDSAKLDLFNTHHNTKDGIHTANMGGTYMAILYGFAGVRLKEDGLHIAPALPASWKSYRFNICYRQRRLEVYIDKKGCKFALLEGAPLKIYLYGEEILLK